MFGGEDEAGFESETGVGEQLEKLGMQIYSPQEQMRGTDEGLLNNGDYQS